MSRRRTSVLTLVVAAVAVSTAVVGTVTEPSHATESARVAESTMRSGRRPRGSSRETQVRGGLHIRGAAEAAGRTVTLEARPEGGTAFSPVGTSVAGPRGGVSLDVQPTVTTRYRWTYAGAEDARPSRSGIARVVIVEDQNHRHRIQTSLSIRAARSWAGRKRPVRGRLRTHGIGLRHRTVSLLSRAVGQPTWQVIGQDLTDRRRRGRLPGAARRPVGVPAAVRRHPGVPPLAQRHRADRRPAAGDRGRLPRVDQPR